MIKSWSSVTKNGRVLAFDMINFIDIILEWSSWRETMIRLDAWRKEDSWITKTWWLLSEELKKKYGENHLLIEYHAKNVIDWDEGKEYFESSFIIKRMLDQ